MRLFALALTIVAGLTPQIQAGNACVARVNRIGTPFLYWIQGPHEDRDQLDQWCRGVGPPLYVPEVSAEHQSSVPDLGDLVIVTWNAHLHAGRLSDLIAALRRGDLTGSPVRHFVLLVQELH